MPIFEYQCRDCGKASEVLVFGAGEEPNCPSCGSRNMQKLISAHSSMSGPTRNGLPGAGDTACCGSAPGQAAGCAGPGSCCGKNFGG